MSLTDEIADLLGIEEPEKVSTKYAKEAISLTDAFVNFNQDVTQEAYDRIMGEVDVDVADSSFPEDLDKLTNYAMHHAQTGYDQTMHTAARMGVDMDPALQRTLERRNDLSTGMAGVNVRNQARIDMRENRLQNMAHAIGMEDHKFQLEIEALRRQQELENLKAGKIPDQSTFNVGGLITGGITGYKMGGDNIWGGIIGGILGAFG